jgi:type I restriction enzyme S subunit
MTLGIAASRWPRSTLGSVAQWGSGGTPRRTNSIYFGGSIPWIVIGDLNDGLVVDAATCITEQGLAKSSAKWVEPGAVLVAMYGSIGKLGIAGRRLTTNQAIAFANPLPDVSGKFLFWYLRSIRRELIAAGKGGTQQNISQTVLKQIPIPLPRRSEQDEIVGFVEKQFSALDDAILGLRRARRRLRQYRQSAIEAAIGTETTLPLRFPHWPWMTLSDVAEIVGGVTKDKKREAMPGLIEVPYLRVANVQRGYLDLDEIKTIRVSPQELARLRLAPGDVLLNEGGDRDKLGRGWIWSGEIDDCVHQNHVFRARLRDSQLDPRFVSWYANIIGRDYFVRHGRQTTNLASINRTLLGRLPVPIPPRPQQQMILDEIDRRESMSQMLQREIGRAERRAMRLGDEILRHAFGHAARPEERENS